MGNVRIVQFVVSVPPVANDVNHAIALRKCEVIEVREERRCDVEGEPARM
jgi:hypothetical protein